MRRAEPQFEELRPNWVWLSRLGSSVKTLRLSRSSVLYGARVGVGGLDGCRVAPDCLFLLFLLLIPALSPAYSSGLTRLVDMAGAAVGCVVCGVRKGDGCSVANSFEPLEPLRGTWSDSEAGICSCHSIPCKEFLSFVDRAECISPRISPIWRDTGESIRCATNRAMNLAVVAQFEEKDRRRILLQDQVSFRQLQHRGGQT